MAARLKPCPTQNQFLKHALLIFISVDAAHAGAIVPTGRGEIAGVVIAGSRLNVGKAGTAGEARVDGGEFGCAGGVEIPGGIDNSRQGRRGDAGSSDDVPCRARHSSQRIAVVYPDSSVGGRRRKRGRACHDFFRRWRPRNFDSWGSENKRWDRCRCWPMPPRAERRR